MSVFTENYWRFSVLSAKLGYAKVLRFLYIHLLIEKGFDRLSNVGWPTTSIERKHWYSRVWYDSKRIHFLAFLTEDIVCDGAVKRNGNDQGARLSLRACYGDVARSASLCAFISWSSKNKYYFILQNFTCISLWLLFHFNSSHPIMCPPPNQRVMKDNAGHTRDALALAVKIKHPILPRATCQISTYQIKCSHAFHLPISNHFASRI